MSLGVIVCRFSEDGGHRCKKISFGDGLHSKCPEEIFLFFQDIISYLLDNNQPWKRSQDNEMIEKFKYHVQEYGYSCRAYVLRNLSHFADSAGKLPVVTFENSYSKQITEQYRWGAAHCAVSAILNAINCKKVSYLNECEILLYLRESREERFSPRKTRHDTSQLGGCRTNE